MNTYSAEFRDKFLKILSNEQNKNIDALFFSGGIDSTTILFGMLELGRKPQLISFKVDGIENKDIVISSEIAKKFDCKHEIITIKNDRITAIEDVLIVKAIINYPMTTHIQCSIPFVYMSQWLSKNGFNQCFTGMMIDDIFGLSKKIAIAYKEQGEAVVNMMRFETVYNPKESDFDIMKVCKRFGVEMIDPYRDDSLIKWLLDIPFMELHTPKKKSITYDAFPEYWNKGKWYRSGDSLQVISGIRDLHNKIFLNDKELNKQGFKNIIGVYNRL